MPSFRVSVAMNDDAAEVAEGELAALPDRIAFEKRFGLSALVLRELDQENPDPRVLREEWVAFLVWRLLVRRHATKFAYDFEAWVENIADEIEVAPLVPVGVPLAPTESLQSSQSSGA